MDNLYLNGNAIKGLPKWAEKLIIILVSAVFLLFIVWYFGIPFDKYRIMKNAQNYLLENHPEIRDKVSFKEYNITFSPAIHSEELEWWDGTWGVYYSSEDDKFLYFMLNFNRKGDLIYDGYEEEYKKGYTIYTYYSNTYNGYFSKIFNDIYERDYIFLGLNPISMLQHTHGNALFEPDIHSANGEKPPVLDINKVYTMEELALEYGTLQFWYGSDEPTKENMIMHRKEAKVIIEEYNIPCRNVRVGIDFSCFMPAIPVEEFMSEDMEDVIEANIYNAYE